ncbi:MAG: 16S rRNA (cytosine(1402)-N(4))-methyltransferase RsmH [Rhodospirillaceae bacterium]|nr:16S rRNA (cytosine(1402)-N(4))-methyltransferase RsmH [Rhodospirillaceae bacterium]
MLQEVLAALAPRDGGIYVDGTFGAGGYAAALLDAADCVVWGIDRDPDAVARGEALVRRYGGRLRLVLGRFGDLVELLGTRGVSAADGVTFDLGVSSMQLDTPERGFSFRADGPLDMRMSQCGSSAADLVNGLSESELANVIFSYGEERRARAIARAIVAARAVKPITRTGELAEIVRRAVRRGKAPARRRGGEAIDPATRTFQALRIRVNDELGELERGLAAAEILLRAGGRLAVVSFHSLEDGRVKSFLRERAGAAPGLSRHAPPAAPAARAAPTFRILPVSGATPSPTEIRVNPRARSARLRAAERTTAAPWAQASASAPRALPGGAA